VRHGAGHALEGGQHAIDALFAVEPAHVEQHGVPRLQAQAGARRRPVTRPKALEIHAGGNDGGRRPHAPAPQLVADDGRGRDDGVAAAREAAAQGERGGADEPGRQRHVVSVLLVPGVIREDHRPVLTTGQATRGRSQQERMVGVEHVEGEPANLARDGRCPRQRQRKLRIGRGRNRRVPHDPGTVLGLFREARGKDPDLVAAGLQPSPQRLHGDGDPAAERDVVVREEGDPHAAARPTPCTFRSPPA
jgi:hypothetical protein